MSTTTLARTWNSRPVARKWLARNPIDGMGIDFDQARGVYILRPQSEIDADACAPMTETPTMQPEPETFASAINEAAAETDGGLYTFLRRRRRTAPKPSSAVPRSAREAGSGTASTSLLR